MTLQRIDYAQLNTRQRETYNFQKAAGVLADYGFACTRVDDDPDGTDFTARHIDGETTHKVQLTGRLLVDRKYQNKDPYMCFPIDGRFYLIEHDVLLAGLLARFPDQMALSRSWAEEGRYSWGAPGKAVMDVVGKGL